MKQLSVFPQIKELVAKALKELGYDLKPEEIFLEHPVEEKHGDYATNIALKIFKIFSELKTQNSKLKAIVKNLKLENPYELAQLITNKINSLLHTTNYILLSSVSAAPPGFINFTLSSDFFADQLKLILKDKLRYGLNQSLNGKNLMVEFAHPNTHKMFHIGHLRNISTGEAIVRILEANGAKVTRANYQGDVGLHIAKCLYGIKKYHVSSIKYQGKIIDELKTKYQTIDERMEFLGKVYAQGTKAYEEDEKAPLRQGFAGQAKKEIIELNGIIYQGLAKRVRPSSGSDPNEEIWKLYKETRQWSLDYFEKIYKRVYSHFDRYYFESEVAELGKKLVLENIKKGVFEKSDGAIIFDGEKQGLHKRVFINSEGFPTYEGKDVGLAKLQFSEYHPDLIIHVVSPEQTGYFKVLFKALEQVFPETCGREFHLIYGWVRLKKGKMSSRLGNVVLGEWLIEELKKKLTEILKKSRHPERLAAGEESKDPAGVKNENFDQTVEAAAIAAVKYSFLKVGTINEIAFDIDESVNLQGDSGPYIQYTYARTQSVLAKSKNLSLRGAERRSNPGRDCFGRLDDLAMTIEELSILRTLYKFPEVVLCAGKNYQPNLICEFLYDLCQKYNLFYNKHRILNAETPELVNQRLVITEAVGIVIRNGLNLLGIKALEKM